LIVGIKHILPCFHRVKNLNLNSFLYHPFHLVIIILNEIIITIIVSFYAFIIITIIITITIIFISNITIITYLSSLSFFYLYPISIPNLSTLKKNILLICIFDRHSSLKRRQLLPWSSRFWFTTSLSIINLIIINSIVRVIITYT
jgi:hypothetical protein